MATTRYGMVIGLRDDKEAEYRALHADDNPGVRDLLSKANIENFSIFIDRLPDGNLYLFGYYEYGGDDYEGDMARLGVEERNKEWLKATDPMQIPLPGQKGWKVMEQVYYNA
jgi:L-rhamnose mutarotase